MLCSQQRRVKAEKSSQQSMLYSQQRRVIAWCNDQVRVFDWILCVAIFGLYRILTGVYSILWGPLMSVVRGL